MSILVREHLLQGLGEPVDPTGAAGAPARLRRPQMSVVHAKLVPPSHTLSLWRRTSGWLILSRSVPGVQGRG